jgi:hypothetical protein
LKNRLEKKNGKVSVGHKISSKTSPKVTEQNIPMALKFCQKMAPKSEGQGNITSKRKEKKIISSSKKFVFKNHQS